MAHHSPPRGNRVPPARLLDESFFLLTHFACCALTSLGHPSYFRLPPRYQRSAAAGRERRTSRMGATSCHLPCIIQKVTAQRQIIFHHDVTTHQQPLRQETRYWKETIDAYNPYRTVASIIEEALANTSSPIPPSPTPLCGPGAYQVNGLTYAAGTEWQVRMHEACTIPCGTLELKEKVQSCHHEVWMHLSHVNNRADERAPRYTSCCRSSA